MRDFEDYWSFREVRGISNRWLARTKSWIKRYLDYVEWHIDKGKTLEYLKQIKRECNISYYRKRLYQIRKFLIYLDIDWANDIKPPAEPEYQAKRITKEDIHQALQYFHNHNLSKQFKAIILLGATSGLRAEELYQLNPDDIDIDECMVHVNHNPSNGQTTKTKKSRISFFNHEAKEALSDYLDFFNNHCELKCLFGQSHIERAFRNASIKVKDLRKFFSQEWDRSGGATTIKKILMGHSLKGDVDLMHYNHQDPEDLKKIYDKVGIRIGI